jgi:hypothetical protein
MHVWSAGAVRSGTQKSSWLRSWEGRVRVTSSVGRALWARGLPSSGGAAFTGEWR